MARVRPVDFTMEYAITFNCIIRGHHIYKDTWHPIKGQCLDCRPDTREEAKKYDLNCLGLYEDQDTLVGHAPVEISCLLTHFLKAEKENSLSVIVIGGRKKEKGLVIPAKFVAKTKQMKIAKILQTCLVAKMADFPSLQLSVVTKNDIVKTPSVIILHDL